MFIQQFTLALFDRVPTLYVRLVVTPFNPRLRRCIDDNDTLQPRATYSISARTAPQLSAKKRGAQIIAIIME